MAEDILSIFCVANEGLGNVISNKLPEGKFAIFANLDYMAKLALEMLQMNKGRRRKSFLCLFLRGLRNISDRQPFFRLIGREVLVLLNKTKGSCRQ